MVEKDVTALAESVTSSALEGLGDSGSAHPIAVDRARPVMDLSERAPHIIWDYMVLGERVADYQGRLGPAERRVAEVVLEDPTIVFGGVAEVAQRAETSEPTVVRLANKLGFNGFVGLRSAVREALPSLIRPAQARIADLDGADPLNRALALEVENVRATLSGVDRETFKRAVSRLSELRRNIWIFSSEATLGIARRFAIELRMLRDGVEVASGTPTAVARRLGLMRRHDVALAMDLRRYESWLIEATQAAAEKGARVIAVTDSLLSPYAELADETFVVTAEAVGPFDSHVGTLSLLNLFVASVAAQLKPSSVARLNAIEKSFRSQRALVDTQAQRKPR